MSVEDEIRAELKEMFAGVRKAKLSTGLYLLNVDTKDPQSVMNLLVRLEIMKEEKATIMAVNNVIVGEERTSAMSGNKIKVPLLQFVILYELPMMMLVQG